MTKDNFSQILISDLKKQAVLIHLSKNDLAFNEIKLNRLDCVKIK